MKVTFDMTVWVTKQYVRKFPTKRQIAFIHRKILRALRAVEHDVEVRMDGVTERRVRGPRNCC